MKKTLINLETIFCLIILVANSQARDLSDKKIKKLEEIGNLLEEAMLENDYDTILKYHDDDIIIMPGFNPAIKGIDELKDAYNKNKREGIKYHSFTAKIEKRWACGNEIFEYGTFGMAVNSKKTSHPKAYYGSYFQIWQEYHDGSFKIKYTIWNLDFNPFE